MHAQAIRTGASRATVDHYLERARHHLRHLEVVMTDDGRIPERFTAGKAGHNTPLGWAQSFYIVAKLSLQNASAS